MGWEIFRGISYFHRCYESLCEFSARMGVMGPSISGGPSGEGPPGSCGAVRW